MPAPTPALVICDGSLASTVGALLEAERCPPLAWVPPAGAGLLPPTGHDHAATLDTVQRHADLRGYADVIDAGDAGGALHGVGRLAGPIALLEALRTAMDRACGRVVWPAAHGSDLDAIAHTAEMALLVTRLAWVGEGRLTGPSPDVETPLLDLTPAALRDLATDLDLAQDAWLAPEQALA